MDHAATKLNDKNKKIVASAFKNFRFFWFNKDKYLVGEDLLIAGLFFKAKSFKNIPFIKLYT